MPSWDKDPIVQSAPPKRATWESDPVVQQAQPVQQPTYDPTEGMSTSDKVLAGIGSGMVSVGRALGLGGVAEKYGLPGTKEAAEKNDAPLMATTAGKTGNAVGHIAATLPAVLIPGANTYTGAALVGGLTGGATTEGDAQERLKGAAGGAVGGVVGKTVGDLAGKGARWVADTLSNKGAAQQAANAGRDAATTAAREAGYKLPPSQANPSLVNNTLEGFAGKASTAQAASNANQQRTNAMVRKALGLAEDTPLTPEVMDSIRSEAGKAYAAVSQVGKIPVGGRDLPAGVKVNTFTDPLTLARRSEVDAGDLVQAWKQSNHDATAYYRAYGRDANPETLAKAKAASSTARRIDNFLTKKLADMGRGDLVQSLKDARTLIAKTYNAEAALNPAAGNVSATQLGTQLAKGKPLSGEMKQVAEFGLNFPKAAQDPTKIGSVLGTSPLDWASSTGLAFATGSPLGLASVAARPAVRSLIMSKPFQAMSANAPSYGPGVLIRTAPQVLDTDVARTVAQVTGTELGRRKALAQ